MTASRTQADETRRGASEEPVRATGEGRSASEARRLVTRLRSMGARVLRRMYLPGERTFVFRLRAGGSGDASAAGRPATPAREPLDALVAEGTSQRYSAITLLGLAGEADGSVREILSGHGLHDVCARLIQDAPRVMNLGDAALICWAAQALEAPGAAATLQRVRQLYESAAGFRTVELAWVVSALSGTGAALPGAHELRERAVQALLSAWRPEAGVFPHDVGAHVPFTRAHVACFADQVYPIQALARHFAATGSAASRDAARRCAERICELQGPAGQWWWHYDARSGRVLEKYPVYYVHQDAMGPMALLDAWQALDGGAGPIGGRFAAAIERGLSWLVAAPELAGGSLIDDAGDVVWRKVARREPNKLSRKLQAGLSRLHPALRAPGLDRLFPPRSVDRETRPYQVGWLFYAWPPKRAEAWAAGA